MEKPAYQQTEESPDTTLVYIIVNDGSDRLISAAIFNNVRRTLEVSKFYDNEHYVNLESFLIHLNPSQSDSVFKVIIRAPQINSQRKKIHEKFQSAEVSFQDDRKSSSDIKHQLIFLLKKQYKLYTKLTDDHELMSVLSLLLDVLKLEKQPTNRSQFQLNYFEGKLFMKLDKACLNALNVFPKTNDKKIVTGTSNIFDILNKCKTTFGARCLKRWMKQPILNQRELVRRNNLIRYFLENSQTKTIFQNQLKKLPDLEKIYFVFYRVQSQKKVKCEVSDLMKLYRVIDIIGQLQSQLESKGLNVGFMQDLYQQIDESYGAISKIKSMIEKFIDMDGNRESQYLVKADAEPGLTAVRKQMLQIRKQIDLEKKYTQNTVRQDIQIIQSATYRYIFEANKKGVVEKVKATNGYKFLSAKQTKITFTTETMIKLCNQFMACENQYKQLQQTVLKKIFKIVAGYYPVLEKLSAILSEIDVLVGWATIVNSSSQNWSMPIFSNRMKITQMRHPCVKNCVSNNVDIVDNKTIIITGPNMGGKSTFIRTVGVCAYLAHIGMFVPADQFETPIIDAIICRVGASDEQIKGISTFMGEMMETSCMLKTATKNSLVLIDELGRGTSTNEGFGICWALCKYLHQQINPYCLFATHFHEMVAIADEVKGISNMYTLTDIHKGKLQFRYKVFEGKMQKSYGIQVAEMLSFPEEIIKDAYEYLELFERKQGIDEYNLSSEQIQAIKAELEKMKLQIQSSSDRDKKSIQQRYYCEIEHLIQNS